MFPKRKILRLQNFDYTSNFAYFVTVCTHEMRCLFGSVKDGEMHLNEAGRMVREQVHAIQNGESVVMENYVVMPNHIHLIVKLLKAEQPISLPEVMRRFKSSVSTKYIQGVKRKKFPPFEKKIWQDSYHDRIIRNQAEFDMVYTYIENNPLKWELDRYYR